MEDRSSPSAARAIMQRHGLHPKKRLGQNFLVDRNILSKIADSCGAGPEQYLVEIGPGLGALTQELAQRSRGVLAIEVDTGLEPILQELADEYPNLRLLFQDILEVDIEAELRRAFALEEIVPYQVCANIPYNITSPILFQLLEDCPHMQAATLMMQKEVAERILAQPGSKDYGRLTLTTAYYAQVEQVMQVSRNCFFPRPEVDSVVLRIVPQHTQRVGDRQEADLKNFIKAAFQKRRKTILNICSELFRLDKAAAGHKLQELGLAANLRPENLTLEEMARLVNAFAAVALKPLGPKKLTRSGTMKFWAKILGNLLTPSLFFYILYILLLTLYPLWYIISLYLDKEGDRLNSPRAISEIKKDLEFFVGSKVRLKANRGRNRIIEREGVLESIYPNIFVSKVE